MDKKIEKIIYKCLLLMEKGYSLDECINKFEDYRDEIKEYFKTINNIKELEKIVPEKDYINNSLGKIISEATRREGVYSEKANAAVSIKRSTSGTKKRLLLRPAMIFLVFLILAVFSFSGTLFASQETVPGQVLYPLKKSFESFKLNIYPESKKGGLHFQFLNNRMHEANILLEFDDPEIGILLEGLIDEIDQEYYMCGQYNCFLTNDEGSIIESINNIKNRHGRMYGKNGNNSTSGNGEKDMGPGMENTGSMGQQNMNGEGKHNADK